MSAPGLVQDPEVKSERLHFDVTPKVADEIRQLAGQLDMSMTQLLKYAISVIKIATIEQQKNRKLVIADENGVVLREFIWPGQEL